MRTNVTSSSTLFWKFFVPVLWISIMATFSLGFLFSDIHPAAIPRQALLILLFVTLGLGILLAALSVFRLKRVEMDSHFVYVTNYFKWFRYPYHNIDRIREHDLILLKIVVIRLRNPGKFGRNIIFLANARALDNFLQEHPGVTEQLFEADAGNGE